MSQRQALVILFASAFSVHSVGCAVEPTPVDEGDVAQEVGKESVPEEVGEAQEAAGFGTGGWIKININTQEGWFKKANGASCVLEVSYHQCSNCGYTNKDTFNATSSNGVCSFFKAYSWPYPVTNFIAAGSATYMGKTLLTGKKTGAVAQSGLNAGLISTDWTLIF